ncbi:MAG: RNA polymerase sigma-70 factor [Aureispira sp.]|nr:RNA polymerase sigma-70 factor [Aureispira sp.]
MSAIINIKTQKQFKSVYDQYFNSLGNYAMAILKDRDAAQDAVQEVFVDLWKKRNDLKIKTSLQAYLTRAVKFKCIDFIRKSQTQQRHINESQASPIAVQEDPYKEDEQQELKQQLSYAIAQLPTKCRKVFLMSRVDGLTYKEIAEDLEISPKTVENQISRALKLLRKTLSGIAVALIFVLLNLFS